jgi:hypothetical protein
MPTRRKSTKRKSHRGRGIREWASKAHAFIKSKNGYSKGLSYAHNRFTKPMLEKRLSKTNAKIVNQGIQMGLSKLKQSGYGLRRSGMGRRLKY